MSKESKAPIGSRWTLNREAEPKRIWIVTGRGFAGSVKVKQEDKAILGESMLTTFLANHTRI